MDIITHALTGKIIALPQKSKRTDFWTILFSLLPDASLIPFYLTLGYINGRAFFIPHNSDWNGARNLYPFLNSIQEISHSFVFAFLIILPIILLFKLPKIAFLGYLAHIILDLPSHTGEWAIKPFYPLNYSIEGFTDAWSWPLYSMAISWIICFIIFIILKKILNDKSINSS